MSDEVHEKLQGVLRQVFGDLDLVVTPTMTAGDIGGWNSLSHLDLMISVERRFGIRFSMGEMTDIREEGRNIGDFEQLIARKLANK